MYRSCLGWFVRRAGHPLSVTTAIWTAAISSASALSGVVLGAWFQGRHGRREAERQSRAELDARFTAFLSAVDALALETQQLPAESKQAALVNSWMAKRMPTLDYFFGSISRAVLGRPLYGAMHDFRLAGNALLFGTPVEVLRACELIADSFKDFKAGSEEFPKKLEQAKADFVVVARMTVTGELHMTWWARVRRRLKRERPMLALPESIRIAQQDHDSAPGDAVDCRHVEAPQGRSAEAAERDTVRPA
jgi:hypothetical protein